MLTQRIESALNDQVNAEFHSAYLYLSMSADLDNNNLSGFAHWMRVKAKEEMTHALKIYDYILHQLGTVTLTAIQSPPSTWANPLAVFKSSFDHEQGITKHIKDILILSREESDFATINMLQWFITEQIEEESNAFRILEKLKMIGDNAQALLTLDSEIGQRPVV